MSNFLRQEQGLAAAVLGKKLDKEKGKKKREGGLVRVNEDVGVLSACHSASVREII